MKDISTHLTQLERSELIRPAVSDRELEYIFRHALVQEAAYGTLLKGDRRQMHRAVGETLERMYPNRREELAPVLARHFIEAGETKKAIDYSRLAARRAVSLFAYDAAVAYLQRALELIDAGTGGSETRLAVLEELGDVYCALGERSAAVPVFQEAVSLWRQRSDPDKIEAVRLYRKIGETIAGMVWLTDFQRFEGIYRSSLEAGLDLMADEPPHPETVRVLTNLAYGPWSARIPADLETADRHAQAAVAIAEQLDAPVELSAALGALASVYVGKGMFRERVELSLRRVALSQDPRFNDMRERIVACHQAGASLGRVGSFTEAMSYLTEAERLASQAQAIGLLVAILEEQALCWLRLDHWDDVLKIEEKWRAIEMTYPDFSERIGRLCSLRAISASAHALRGEYELSGLLKNESLAMMIAGFGPTEAWGRSQKY